MKPLLALTDRCCRWPVGEHPPLGQMQHQLWCGAPRASGDLFCPEHMRIGCPGWKVTPAQVRARNLVTIKLALMRRESRTMPVEHAVESREVAAERERIEQTSLAEKLRPTPANEDEERALYPYEAAMKRAAGEAPKGGIIPPLEAQKPASAGPEQGTETSGKSGGLPTDTLRPVQPLDHPVAEMAPWATSEPIIEWMAPADLLIEGAYQRDLSPKSLDLIRRIVAGWDWRRFKPPIVAWTERGFEIIDGQHTAIAAATRPDIEKIPVLVVEALAMNERANAFVGHNQDRLSITPIQMHRAKIAAGDADALTVQQVLDRAGAVLVVGAYGQRGWKPGETVAVSTIDSLAKRRGARGARMVLEVLVKAEAAPISAAAIKAVDMLMNRPEYAEADTDHLPAAIQQSGDVESQAKLDAKTHGIPAWEAMGRIWFRKCRKKRSAA